MEELTRREVLKSGLAIAVTPPLFGAIEDVGDVNQQKVETGPDSRNKTEVVEPGSFLHACYMDIMKFNHERGFLTDEQYNKIRKGPVIKKQVGRRIYFGTA